MSTVDLINLLIISAGVGVSVMCFLQIANARHLQKEVRRYFQVFFLFIIVYAATHLARQIMNGIAGNGVRIALYTVTCAETLSAGFMAYLMSILILFVAKKAKEIKPLAITLLVLLCVHIAILAVCESFEFLFTFDANNVYSRANGYIISNVCPIIMLFIDAYLLIRYRKTIERRVLAAFWNYVIAPVVAIALQSLFYGIQFIIYSTIVAAIFMVAVILRNLNEQYEKQKAESSRIDTELSMASGIQADMLPNIYPAFPDRPEFDIYATMNPAKEVGGDFYDFFLTDEDHLCMVMADVSGKGVPAALFMMACKIILANNAMLGKSPAQILTDANAAICQNNREEMFVTVWLGILELSTGKLVAANAGHEYPVLKQADGKYEVIKDKHGFVMGGMDGVKYTDYELCLKPGAKLFLYTDGVPEATDAENNLFGTERMINALNEDPYASPEDTLKGMRRAVDGFVKDAEQFDDITMLCLEYVGKGERPCKNRLVINAETENLSAVLEFIDGILEKNGCPLNVKMQIDVSVEEIFVNIAHYAYKDGVGKAEIVCDVNPDRAEITFSDGGVPYDPLKKPDPDVTLGAEERQIGGLGIYMVKKQMDDVIYEYKGGKNVLKIVKFLTPPLKA